MAKIMEFNLEDFNGDMREAFGTLFYIYQNSLHTDPDWHFFYEGDFTILRCGEEWVEDVRTFLAQKKVSFKWHPKEWKEPWELTLDFQGCFGPIFHSFSVLVMELFKRKQITTRSDELILNSADRIIHPFLNMATYLKYFQAGGGGSKPLVKWEAEVMATLTIQRAHIAGMIVGEQRMKRIMEAERREDEATKVNKEGEGEAE